MAVKVNPPSLVEAAEKLMLAPLVVVAPNVAVPVWVALPGAVAEVQLALALKSKLPSAGLVTVGAACQVASCANAGRGAKTPNAKTPTRIVAIAAVRHATRLNCPATAPAPLLPGFQPLSTAAARWPDYPHSMADASTFCYQKL